MASVSRHKRAHLMFLLFIIEASGASVVEYIGDPVLNISTSGSATVKKR